MPIPAGSVKFVISGVLPGGEQFQTAWWEKWDGVTAIDNAFASAVATSAPFTTMTTNYKASMHPQQSITGLDVYLYNGGSAAASHGHASLAIVGTSAVSHPNQCALVTTLRTATPGRSGRGRMYWPWQGGVYSSASGLWSNANVDSFVDALATFFSTRNAVTPSVIIVSQTTTAQHLVTSVDADYVPDVQRRRAKKQSSTRHSHAV